MSIGPYTISPFINNRQLNTACGLGNHDTENTFLVSSYTSGNPSEVGLCIQGAGGAALDSGAPIDTTQLWIDFLKSSVNFTIDTPQLTINNNLSMNGTFTNEDSILGTITEMIAGAITATNWTIDTTGLGTFNTLTVNSISTVTTLSLSGTVLNIPLGAHAIDKSWTITINNNVTSLVPTAGVIGGVYKLWLTVGATPRTFTKACGVINDLLGDTLMVAGSIWLITIYKRSAATYRATFDNFT